MTGQHRMLVIGHDHVTELGALGTALEELGYSLSYLDADPARPSISSEAADALSSPRAWDAILTVSTPQSLPLTAPWWARELSFLRQAHLEGVPVIGLGFGAHLLCTALGGGVGRISMERLGFSEITPLDRLIDAGPWFRWHRDRLLPPTGADILARSVDGVEAFTLGRSMGVQFYPHVDPAMLQSWVRDERAGSHAWQLDMVAQRSTALDTKALAARAGRFADYLTHSVVPRIRGRHARVS